MLHFVPATARRERFRSDIFENERVFEKCNVGDIVGRDDIYT